MMPVSSVLFSFSISMITLACPPAPYKYILSVFILLDLKSVLDRPFVRLPIASGGRIFEQSVGGQPRPIVLRAVEKREIRTWCDIGIRCHEEE